MKLRSLFFSLILCLSVLGSALAEEQGRKTLAAGETGLRVEVEGRGNILILLHTKEAPRTTAKILNLVRSKFYDQLRVHRVEKSPKPFLVQVGDPQSRSGNLDNPTMGSGGSGEKVAFEETSFPNTAGAVGLAASPTDRNSGDSQFYMLLGNATFLDGNYTVFGKVLSGMDVLHTMDKGDRIKSITVVTG